MNVVHVTAKSMNYLRLRNNRHRIVLLVGATTAAILLICLMHNTHQKVVSVRARAEDCEQKQESLAAQFQVVSELKVRLDKSIQQEKQSHKQTKDKLEAQYEDLQETLEKERQDALMKYNALQQELKVMKEKYQTDNALYKNEIAKLQQMSEELEGEMQADKKKYAKQLQEIKSSSAGELVQLQAAIAKLQQENQEYSRRQQNFKQVEAEFEGCQHQVSLLLNAMNEAAQQPSDANGNSKSPMIGPHRLTAEDGTDSKHSIPQIHYNGHQMTMGVTKHMPWDSKPATKQSLLPIEGNVIHPESVGQVVPRSVPDDLKGMEKGDGPLNIHPRVDKTQSILQKPDSNLSQHIQSHWLPLPKLDKPALPEVAEVPGQVEQPNPKFEANKQIDDAEKGVLQVPQQHDEREDGAGAGGQEVDIGDNGLEQQEPGGDQDLDNMDNDVGGARKNLNGRFGDEDFDQVDQDEKDANNAQMGHHGVIAPSH